MKNNKNIFIASAMSVVMIGFSVLFASAQSLVNTSNVIYPIAELGNCKDKDACRDYCDQGTHMVACINFAEKKGMMSGENLRISKIVAEKVARKETPGGCSTEKECSAFCEGKVENMNACIAFGEELGVIPKEQLAEAKKIAGALSRGAKMPGSCKTKAECENFCADGSHIDECLNFAESAGILPADQLAEARKVAPFLKNKETPGKCMTKESCDAYCKEDTHFDECVSFAEKAGFISGEDATLAKKVGGKGPGGCKGKEECMSYCNMDEHAVECANFAKDKGLLTDKQKEDINTGVDRMKAGLEQIPPEAKAEIVSCLQDSLGQEKYDRIMSKQDMPTQAMGGKIEACFGKVQEIMQTKMMKEGGVPSGAGGGSAPSKEEIRKKLPANIPPEMRAKIEAQIEAGIPEGAPTGAPAGVPNIPPPPSGAPTQAIGGGMPAPTPELCAKFAGIPNCSMAGPGEALCNQCKGQ